MKRYLPDEIYFKFTLTVGFENPLSEFEDIHQQIILPKLHEISLYRDLIQRVAVR